MTINTLKNEVAASPISLAILGASPRAKGPRNTEITKIRTAKISNMMSIRCLSPSLKVFSQIAQILCMLFLDLFYKPFFQRNFICFGTLFQDIL